MRFEACKMAQVDDSGRHPRGFDVSVLHAYGRRQRLSLGARALSAGGLENIWSFLTTGANIQKIFAGTMTLFFFLLAFALVFGRAFCGNLCPFGFLQELLGKITKKKLRVPAKLDKALRLLKYAALALITLTAWITLKLWISPYDPYTAFAHIWSGPELFSENLVGFIILIVVVVLSVFIDRFFCRYLCPAGAVYGLIAKISPLKVKHDACVMCGKCSKVCPVGIDVAHMDVVSSPECIACGECVNACPSKEQPLNFTFAGRVVKPIAFVLVTVALFFGSLLAFDALNLMRLTTPTVEAVAASGEHLSISELKGSMTIADGAAYVGMDIQAFRELMEIPENVPDETKFKEISQFVAGYDFHQMVETNGQ